MTTMGEMDDEAIQQLVENQLKRNISARPFKSSKEEDLYRILFKELADDSIAKPKNGIEDLVVHNIQSELDKKDAIRYNMTIAVVLLMGVLLFYLAIILINPGLVNPIMLMLKKKEVIVLFIIFIFGTVHMSDWLFNNLKLRNAK